MDIILIGSGVNAAATILAAAWFGWLYSAHQQDHLLSWSWGWLCAGIAIALSGLVIGNDPLTANAPYQLASAAAATSLGLGALFLLRGAFQFSGRRLPGLWWLLLGASGLVAAVGVILGAAPALIVGVPALLSEVGLLMCAVALLRHARRRTGARVAAGGYIAMVVNSLTYPLIYNNAELVTLGFLGAAALALITAGGLLVLHYDETLERLRDSEQRYRDLFDNAFVGVFQATPEGRLVRANGALAHTLGLTAAEIEAGQVMLPARLVDPDDWAPLTSDLAPVIEGRDVAWWRPEGGEVRTVLHARRVDPPTGPAYCAGVLQDVTEAHHLRRQLAAARRFEALGGLASGVAHDFNNLLTVIIGELELLRLRAPADADTSLDAIEQAADQAARLTRQLLAFGRGSVFEPVDLELGAVLEDTLLVLRRVIPEHVELVVQRPRALHARIDRASMEQLISNLVSNASAAMPAGGRLGVTLSATPAERGRVDVALTVSDDGVGMDEHTRARMFEPFFTTRAMGRGTGLGLATVHGIVTQLGGRLEVESSPGHGTTITARLTLPASADHAASSDTARHATPGGLAVLVVEDQPDVRAITAATLRSAGHRVTEAEDGEQALALIKGSADYDIVVTDVVMPHLGGVQLAERLRAAGISTPVVLVTGYAQASDPLPPGVLVLPKPFAGEALLTTLARAMAMERSAA